MDFEKVYTSTGNKLIFHPEAVMRFKDFHKATPISLQVALTSRCNLKCSFCSNVNRKTHESIDADLLQDTIIELLGVGLKTVEWTGGGDPTLYPKINEMISFCHKLGLEQGLITNGVQLAEKVSRESLNVLKWVRISMNCLEYVGDIAIPEIPGTLGFSYVYNEKTTSETIEKIRQYAAIHRAEYVRVVPNCLATDEQQERNNVELAEFVKTVGYPFFYQAKHFRRPASCYWGLFKPFVLHDGWVYPCSSVVLNESADRQFHERFRMCRLEKLPQLYLDEAEPVPTTYCNHCVFYPQNAILGEMLNRHGMENFI